jgi:hypothetical protein
VTAQTEASRLFDELNRRYWRGRLPRYRIIQRSTLSGGALGQCRDGTRTILIAPHASVDALRATLLHEMCHIGTGPGLAHGPRFVRKLRRLVKLGESPLLEDVERYDGTDSRRAIEETEAALGKKLPEMPFAAALESDLEAAAFSGQWRRRWSTIAAVLAPTYQMTVPQFRRAAPWAERTWRELVADRRASERTKRAWASAALNERLR